MLDGESIVQCMQVAQGATSTSPVPWYVIAGCVLVGASMLTHGTTMIARAWEHELNLPAWTSVVGTVVGIIVSLLAGSLVGTLVWRWELGLLVALVGSMSSSLVLSVVKSRLGLAKDRATLAPPSRSDRDSGGTL